MKKYNLILITLVAIAINSLNYGQEAVVNETLQQDAGVISPEAPPEDTANLPVIPTDPDSESVGITHTADEIIRTILVDDYEVPQGWMPSIPLDFGISKILYRDGAPKEIASDNNKYVLGVKTMFFRRNFGWMSIDRPYPVSIRNFVKSFSLWVVGRNLRHRLYIKVRDILGHRMRVPAGEMRWQGWKKLIVPVTDPVTQFEYKINRRGLDFLGFHLAFEAEDIVVPEPYYIYFDYLTATINFVHTQAEDDMIDTW